MSEAFVSPIGVRAMLAIFANLGLDARRIQRESAIDDADLTDPDRLLPAARMYRMWEVADRQWARPGLGLAAGSRVPFGAYEVLDYLVLSGATMGEGLTDFARYFAVATRTARYDIHQERKLVAYEMVWQIPPGGVMFHLRDYSLATVAHRVKEACRCVPERIELAGPLLAAPEEYERCFGTGTVSRAARNALVFSARSWNAPQPRRDAYLQRTLRRHAELLLERSAAETGQTVVDLVRRELLSRVRVGLPTVDEVARGLGMGSRTLQRRLRNEGASFADLANQVRAGLAREYLRDQGLNIGEVAYLLGFSEPSAFSRAFRRWTGKSPGAFRTG